MDDHDEGNATDIDSTGTHLLGQQSQEGHVPLTEAVARPAFQRCTRLTSCVSWQRWAN